MPTKRQQPTAAERQAAAVEGLRRREVIGKALETWRVQNDVTQEAAASRAGCTTKTWGRLEAGESKTRRIYYIAERVAGWPPGSIETYLASGVDNDLAFLTPPAPKDETLHGKRLTDMERQIELLASQVAELVEVVVNRSRTQP